MEQKWLESRIQLAIEGYRLPKGDAERILQRVLAEIRKQEKTEGQER